MIGKTNAVVGGGVPTEKVNVTLTSNQSSTSDLSGAKVTLSYGSYSEVFTWSGKTITLSVMQYITYTLSFSNVSGYKTPVPVEFTAVADNVRQVSAQYQTEVVTVTVSADNGASVSGKKVTINGVTTTLTRTGKVSQKVPYDTSYSVSVNDKSGYNTPATQEFTASQPTRSVSMVYEEYKLGVYIQDTTGKLWTYDAWDDSATPNGVAVLTDACRFVISLHQGSLKENCDSSRLTLPIYSTSSEAIKDYSGSSNTTELLSVSYGITAASYCRDFIFPNGKSGYLGSAGEWEAANDNRAVINECMSKCGGWEVTGNRYWTSTRAENEIWCDEGSGMCYAYNQFWFMYWIYDSWGYTGSYNSDLYARPFTTL